MIAKIAFDLSLVGLICQVDIYNPEKIYNY